MDNFDMNFLRSICKFWFWSYEDDSDDDGGDMSDLDSAGSSWLEEQGFETRDPDN